MRRTAAFLLPLFALAVQSAAAQELAYADVVQNTAFTEATYVVETHSAERFVEDERAAAQQPAVAVYGPFRVIDGRRAELIGITDAASPRQFDQMLRDHPGIATIEMVDCPGTDDDRANLRLGLMIHQKGIATHVPEGGWVASGAVELFLAGVSRAAEPTARFAVHSWEDDAGLQPQDYATDAPKNRAYLDYYQAVGMSAAEARAFYAMTNSVPFESARMLSRAEMAQWARFDEARPLGGQVQLAALDSAPLLQ